MICGDKKQYSYCPNLVTLVIRLGSILALTGLFASCQQAMKKEIPFWVNDGFKVDSINPAAIPPVFKNGYILLSRRDEPGMLYLLKSDGQVAWYHQVKGTGFKTAHFTENHTIISILGGKEYPTSYGNQVLEINLQGDTLLHLVKGTGDFINNAHHEVLLKGKDEIVLLSSVEKQVDLSAVGGKSKDTVKSDGIRVLDRQGRKRWEWSVFEALNPLLDTGILQSKNDWMHANSLSFDRDGNYLVSFYNNGQIWKLDAITGKVIWKFGRNGDFRYPATAEFDMGHSVHINKDSELMFFDNGVTKQASQALAFRLQEADKTAMLTLKVAAPPSWFNDRMGSVYLVGNDYLLFCASKRNTIWLADRKGTVIWTLRCNFIPYRAEFIPAASIPELK